MGARAVTALLSGNTRMLDSIDLRFSRSKVAEAYEQGTACAYWYPADGVPSDKLLERDLLLFARLLAALYDSGDMLRSPDSEATLVRSQLDTVRLTRKRSAKLGNRQGYGLEPAESRAVELHAMALATSTLVQLGYENIEDTSATSSYDLSAIKDGTEIVVEVKGTTGLGELILLTFNEVELHAKRHPNNVLVIVHSIDLDRRATPPVASGGEVKVVSPWVVEAERLKALTYSYRFGS